MRSWVSQAMAAAQQDLLRASWPMRHDRTVYAARFNKKPDVKKDFKGKNKSSFDKIISLSLTKIFGFCNLTTRFNSIGFKCILVF